MPLNIKIGVFLVKKEHTFSGFPHILFLENNHCESNHEKTWNLTYLRNFFSFVSTSLSNFGFIVRRGKDCNAESLQNAERRYHPLFVIKIEEIFLFPQYIHLFSELQLLVWQKCSLLCNLVFVEFYSSKLRASQD